MSANAPSPELVLDPLTYIRLEVSQLCADCDAIYRLSRHECPSCGSGSALPLGKILDADENRELAEGLRSLSRLMAWAKRPTRPKLARAVEAKAETAEVAP
jgi:hypothetical protein